MLWPKKNSYKEFANEKKFRRLENSPPPPPPPITFLMVRSLTILNRVDGYRARGVLTNVLRWEAQPRDPTPYPFIYQF